MFTELNGSFNSPDYPHEYPNNANCTYDIQVPENMKILLVIHFFSMQTNADKLELRQMVSGSDNFVARLTGFENTARNYTSDENRFTLLFTSDDRYTYRGFQATYHAIQPGKQVKMLFYGILSYVSHLPRLLSKLNPSSSYMRAHIRRPFRWLSSG